MDKVLHGLQFCYVYIDDLLIASSSPEEHKRHLRLVLERLDAHGIIINPQKCEFGVSSLNFLGHRVDRWGIHPLEEKVQVIREFPQPTTQRKLREFLGLVNFYHRFVPHGADILQPLNSLLAAPKDSAKTLLWSDVATTAFSRIKEALANATILSHPKPEALTCIMADASNTAVGAVLQQFIDGQWRPISYFSKKLRPPETRYSTFDRELLAIYLAIKHFRHFVEGRVFHISTDHKPLTYAPTTRSDRHSPRQARHLDFILQFTSDIRHVKGTDNAVADALSRIEANALLDASPPQVDFVAMAEAQRTDPELSELRLLLSSSSLTLAEVPLSLAEGTIVCDTSTGVYTPAFCTSSFSASRVRLSSFTLPPRNTCNPVTGHYPVCLVNVNRDVRKWTQSCLRCQRAKVQRHTVTPLSTFKPPDVRFDQVHIDLVGPLPPSHGYTYMLTCIDRYTMARGNPNSRHHGRMCSSSLHSRLDCQIWSSIHGHHRPWTPI